MNIETIKNAVQKTAPGPMKPHDYYGVMVPLIKDGDNFSLLFEVRSNELNVQPGEICFPGGGKEEGETPEECAIRETCEELCISPDKINLIGPIDYLNAYSNFTLYPFVGIIDYEDIKDVPFNHDEVQDTFLVPLEFFLNNDPLIFNFPVTPKLPNDFPYKLIDHKEPYEWRKGKLIIPIYSFEGRTIWGLTARIAYTLTQLLKEKP